MKQLSTRVTPAGCIYGEVVCGISFDQLSVGGTFQ
jgi:hypothetical protein